MRRYSARQSVSFGRSDEYARRRQGVIIAVLAGVLAAGVLIYFLILAPTLTTKADIQQRYRVAMKTEIKQANSMATSSSFSRTGGWGEGYETAIAIRSKLYGVTVLYKLYLEYGGSEIPGFATLESVITMVDNYTSELTTGVGNTANLVGSVQNAVGELNNAIEP